MSGPATDLVRIDAAGRTVDLEVAFVGAAGAEPPLVFLHEGLGSVAMWKDFPARLCERLGRSGLVYSRFGYGRSTPRPAGERFPVGFMHREARVMLPALLDALGIARADLFGHSDGASIALLAAAHQPARYGAVVVLAPHVFVEPISVESIARAKVAYLEQGLRARLARYHDDVDSAFWGWNDVWLDPDFLAWNIEAEVGAVRCPVLAVQGVDDEYGTLEQIRAIRRRLPKTRLLELANCGHSPHRDQPEAVIAATAAFLDAGPRIPIRNTEELREP
ncbi:MAG: alpha/beta fold hydrolase [Betaproteobacteria bacterium]